MTHKINHPAKVLSGNSTSAIGYKQWPYDDGEGDQWWSGGAQPKFYQWSVDITLNLYTHGSHLTRKPFEYNGLDITVGDWIGDATSGVSLKIISVASKTETTATLIVEDVLRYNTFRSPTGDGLFNVPGTLVVFTTNELGEPVLDPLPAGIISSDFVGNAQSRFSAFALQENFQLTQAAHGFTEGDAVAIDPSTQDYEKADSNSLEYVVGTVGSDGPGPDAFLLKPTTRIIEHHRPAFPGATGSFIYADPDNPGELTTTKTTRKAFLQLTDSVESSAIGTAPNPISTIGFQLKINGAIVTLTGTTLAQAVIDINAASSLTGGVVASAPFAPTVASSSLALLYGLVGSFPTAPGPASATINGSLVTFTDIIDGFATYALNVAVQSDMARDINAAGIPNIVASSDATDLIITEANGAAITIVNITNDQNGTPFAGPNTSTGIPLVTPATTDQFLKLTKPDGDGILLQNETGDPLGDFGLVSVDNGRLPVGLVIEQGIRKGDLFVVADTTERDALDVLTGDQAYTLDKGDGEWGLFLYDGASWIITSTEESARVDSDTVARTITFASNSITFIAAVDAGTDRTGSGTRVSPVSIEVITPFDGSPTITVGDDGDNARLFSDELVDLSTAGNYQHAPTHQYTGGVDTPIKVFFGNGGSTVGEAKVTITYS